MKDAILIQAVLSSGEFADMLRLAFSRHAAYARAHGMDYWAIFGDVVPDKPRGAWGKIELIRQALRLGYQNVFWLDADAAVLDMGCDLRQALPPEKHIGAVQHWASWFPKFDIPRHFNVGVLYMRAGSNLLAFADDWISRYPGDRRWMDQGSFNQMITEPAYQDLFCEVDAAWNATVNVNMVASPYVMGWHGIMPVSKRTTEMRSVLGQDHLVYRV